MTPMGGLASRQARHPLVLVLAALVVILVCFPAPLLAAPGDLDQSFGNGGIVKTSFAVGASDALDLAIQADGKLVVAGWAGVFDSSFALARYNPDGNLDATFGFGGKVTTDFSSGGDGARAIALQPDDKLVVVGHADSNNIALARYNIDGTLDPGFGNGGKVTTDVDAFKIDDALDVALQPDGKIVVAGRSGGDFALARYLPDGSLDTSFGTGGTVMTDFGRPGESAVAVVLQPNGKIVLAASSGGDFALARYNADGSPDLSFGAGGTVKTDFGGRDAARAIVLQPDDNFVVAGESSSRFALARYLPDGNLDTSFGTGGTVTTQFGLHGWSASAIALQPDGKIVVAGGPGSAVVVVRYTPDGGLDLPFGDDGVVATDFGFGLTHSAAVALQPDGKIVVAGTSAGTFALARYEGGSVPGAPFLRLDVNRTDFVPGETLRIGILEANFGPPVMVDKYLGALLPPGTGPAFGCPADDAIVFLTTRMVPTCLSAPLQSFDPVARNLLLPEELPPTSTPDFFSGVWPVDAPAGTYLFFTAFARAGTVDLLALATARVSLSNVPPQTPFDLAATTFCRTVTLSWRDRNVSAEGYRIERRSGIGSFVEIATIGPRLTSFRDNGLTPGVAYTYRVRAFRGILTSEYSNEATTTGGPDPPQAPTNLTAIAVSSGNVLHWQDNSSDESGFRIESRLSALLGLFGSDWFEIATVGPNVTAYEDRNLRPLSLVSYAYRVRAFNGSCPSNYSDVSAVTR
jgi:uncharacterized delta-60 repeat protein